MKKPILFTMFVIWGIMGYCIIPFNNERSLYLNNSDPNIDKFSIGFGLGFGFFDPEDVNNYLSYIYSSSNGYNMEFGTTDIFMNENLSFVISIHPVKLLRVNIVGEAGIAPKLITLNTGNSDFYNFGRYSGGIETYFNLPFGSGRHSFIFGVGSLYHHLYFDDYSGDTFGLRVIPFGMAFNFGKFKPQIMIGGDLLTKAIDKSYSEYSNDFELNYDHGFVHINFLF